MSHIPITILAYFLNSVAVLVDKFLLTKHIPDPLIYIFYISIFSLVSLLLLPFTHLPTLPVFILASTSTILWTSGAYCMYKALQKGLASRVIPMIGTLIPLILLFQGIFSHQLNTSQIGAIILLTTGLVLLTLPDWKGKITKAELLFVGLSAVLFAVSYLVLHQAYLQEHFLTVLVYSRFILIPVGLGLVLLPFTRKIVLAKNQSGPPIKFFSKTGVLFLFGQASGGASELLLTFSISLATPALVNSLQGSQYVFLFFFSLLLARKYPDIFKERFDPLIIVEKVGGIVCIGAGLYLLAFSTPL